MSKKSSDSPEKRRGGRDNRDKSSYSGKSSYRETTGSSHKPTKILVDITRELPKPNNSYSVWKGRHDKIGCLYGCVTPESHFRHWRSTYGGVLRDFYREITKSSGYIPYQEFLKFTYSVSSGYISEYV